MFTGLPAIKNINRSCSPTVSLFSDAMLCGEIRLRTHRHEVFTDTQSLGPSYSFSDLLHLHIYPGSFWVVLSENNRQQRRRGERRAGDVAYGGYFRCHNLLLRINASKCCRYSRSWCQVRGCFSQRTNHWSSAAARHTWARRSSAGSPLPSPPPSPPPTPPLS